MGKTLKDLAEEIANGKTDKKPDVARAISNDDITIVTECDRITMITPLKMIIGTQNSLEGYNLNRNQYSDVVDAVITNVDKRAGYSGTSYIVERGLEAKGCGLSDSCGGIQTLRSPFLREPEEYKDLNKQVLVIPIAMLGGEGFRRVV